MDDGFRDSAVNHQQIVSSGVPLDMPDGGMMDQSRDYYPRRERPDPYGRGPGIASCGQHRTVSANCNNRDAVSGARIRSCE